MGDMTKIKEPFALIYNIYDQRLQIRSSRETVFGHLEREMYANFGRWTIDDGGISVDVEGTRVDFYSELFNQAGIRPFDVETLSWRHVGFAKTEATCNQ